MSNVRLAVIYYSTYGTNFKMAQIAEDAAEAAGAEVRLLKVKEIAPEDVVEGQEGWRNTRELMRAVPEVTPDDMEWANAYLFSAPTRYGVQASQMRAFIDTMGWSNVSTSRIPKVVTRRHSMPLLPVRGSAMS